MLLLITLYIIIMNDMDIQTPGNTGVQVLLYKGEVTI